MPPQISAVALAAVLAICAAGCGEASPSAEPTGSARAQELAEDHAAAAHQEAEYKRDQQLGHRYPAAAQQAFITGCKAGEHALPVCRCWLHKVEEHDSLPELEAITTAALASSASIPRGVKEALESCVFNGG
jgi:hypothetical protein